MSNPKDKDRDNTWSPFPRDVFPEEVFPDDVFPSDVFPRGDEDSNENPSEE